ncbi:MAG: hypothetical protein Q9163_000090 [Psora crenata]
MRRTCLPTTASPSKLPADTYLPSANEAMTDGTVVDTAHLINYIPSYIFPQEEHVITINIVCGVSLGGHAAWQCLVNNPAITASISIVGCPDYIRLMTDRAGLSKLPTYTEPPGHGSSFLGSADFPNSLVDAVRLYDPAARVLSKMSADAGFFYREITDTEKRDLLPEMQRSFRDKRMLNMSGGADKLVPYACSQPFLQWIKRAITPSSGWFSDSNFHLHDIVFEGVGHAMSPKMAEEVDRFIVGTLAKSHRPSSRHKVLKI